MNKLMYPFVDTRKKKKQDAPLMALHRMLNVPPFIPHWMLRRFLKTIFLSQLK